MSILNILFNDVINDVFIVDIYVFPLLLLNGLSSLEFIENNILYTISKNQVALNEYQDL